MFNIFIRFLKEKGIYSKYVECIRIENYEDIKKLLKDIKKHKAEEYLLASFGWSDKPEGFIYWSDMSFEWEKFVEQLKAEK